MSLLAIVCSSSCRQNVLETGKALWQGLNPSMFSQFWNHETLAQSPIISGTLVTEIIFQGLNLPLIALPVPPMPTSPLPVGEGLTEALREFWHKLVSHLPRIPGMPSLYLSSVFTLPSLTMPSMPAMFTLRIDHYTHMPSLPSLPSLPSIPLMDLPFSTLVIAILLASLLFAFVISAHLKEDKVNIPNFLHKKHHLQVWKRTELGGLLTLLALLLLLPAIATHISKAREAEEVKHILVNINMILLGKDKMTHRK